MGSWGRGCVLMAFTRVGPTKPGVLLGGCSCWCGCWVWGWAPWTVLGLLRAEQVGWGWLLEACTDARMVSRVFVACAAAKSRCSRWAGSWLESDEAISLAGVRCGAGAVQGVVGNSCCCCARGAEVEWACLRAGGAPGRCGACCAESGQARGGHGRRLSGCAVLCEGAGGWGTPSGVTGLCCCRHVFAVPQHRPSP